MMIHIIRCFLLTFMESQYIFIGTEKSIDICRTSNWNQYDLKSREWD